MISALRSPPPPPPPSSTRFRPPRIARVSAHTSSDTCSSPPKLASFSCASLYEVLGIPMGATGMEIKAAYRKLARTCHPDAVAIGRKDSTADDFIKVHAAYSTLSDPEKRADYDRRLFRSHRSSGSYSVLSASPESVISRFPGYTRRNWETDQCW
ncbi:hypothetical protein RJ639_042979 [Escallonia herrerae]|uniref:J domain-containing protein n=1 Tax=Escallonia herrerae TaxID=1293975 RepID=A0AA88WBC3_9ASTE|nr:hypothetical protein RJ639_042979 [Escallonia herrerae]